MSTTEWTPIAGCLVTNATGRSWREEAATWLLAEVGPGSSHWPDQLDKAGFLEWEHPASDAPEEESYSMARVRSDHRTARRHRLGLCRAGGLGPARRRGPPGSGGRPGALDVFGSD